MVRFGEGYATDIDEHLDGIAQVTLMKPEKELPLTQH